ncbi:hypothetical protein GCM10010517_17150 [Streptosporangium fragile]|uniref:LysR substrate-binding domain-containing protein n=1 Tax=Streptosporangium fragile TaxID=46186 RepID=A0ABP6I995_9ACTN
MGLCAITVPLALELGVAREPILASRHLINARPPDVGVSSMREGPHRLVNRLPEAELPPALKLICGRLDERERAEPEPPALHLVRE